MLFYFIQFSFYVGYFIKYLLFKCNPDKYWRYRLAKDAIKGAIIVKNQTIQTIFADFALFAVTKIMHRKERKERKVFRIYVKYIMSLTIIE